MVLAALVTACQAPTASEELSVKPGINTNFLDPELDVDKWVARFETESREVFTNRSRIARAVGAGPGMVVADVGAGTGLYVDFFARDVGPGGRVYAGRDRSEVHRASARAGDCPQDAAGRSRRVHRARRAAPGRFGRHRLHVRHLPSLRVSASDARVDPSGVEARRHVRRRRLRAHSRGLARVAVHYEVDRPPWIEARIQDFFGVSSGPSVAGGRVPLVLHLLAPNDRAVQVTTDLARFWQEHYPSQRKELSRRYPRHHFPEDPLSARPIRLKSRL